MRRSHNVFKNAESLKLYNLAIWVDQQILKKSKKDVVQAVILKRKINDFYERCSSELDEILKQGVKDEQFQ